MSPSLLYVGKHPGQSLVATGSTRLINSRLFYVTDHNSNLRLLVDTGAEVSLIPPSKSFRSFPQEGLSLHAANGSPITTYGRQSLTLNLGLRRTFSLWQM